MRFPPSFLDELRSRLRVSDVVGKRVPLKRKGREYAACCPFHKEKTPSFYVNDQKGFYHCFGCGAHGDAIGFVVEYERLRYPEAVERLAEEVGLPVPVMTPEVQERIAREATLHDVMERACAWFQKQLYTNAGATARGYVERRAIPRDIESAFRLGFAPADYHALSRALTAGKDITAAQLEAVGLLGRRERSPQESHTFDKFRGRLMFPIQDARGQVVAFGGRLLEDGEPKYLNSPETELFKKGELLYNFHRARPAALEAEQLIVAEGYMDVIALTRAGLPQAVAPMGTALTEGQLGHLWRTAREPVLCFDGDAAGQRAMERAITLALPHVGPERTLRLVRLPQGADPDDLLRAEGAEGVRRVFARSLPLAEALWGQSCRMPLRTPEERARREEWLMAKAGQIQHAGTARHYRDDFRNRLWEARRAEFSGGRGKSGGTHAPQPGGNAPAGAGTRLAGALHAAGKEDTQALQFLGLALWHPALLQDALVEEHLADMELPEGSACRAVGEALTGLPDAALTDREHLCAALEEVGAGEAVKTVLAALCVRTAPFASDAMTEEDALAYARQMLAAREAARRKQAIAAVHTSGTALTESGWAHMQALKEAEMGEG